MKTYLFVNPASGHHSVQRLQSVLEKLALHAINPEVMQVRTPDEILARCSVINEETEPSLLIVAGGDGTINAVVNSIKAGSANTLAILPFGTSNVLAAELGITSILDGVERIIAGNTRSLTVGVLEMESRTLRFLLMAGIGLDGAVVRDVRPHWKKTVRQGAYALSALSRALHWDKETFSVRSPAGDISCHTAIICNAARYGGNFILSPDSSIFSPGLSAVCITGNSRSIYLGCALDLFRNRVEKSRHLVRMDASTFEIEGRHPIQIDGDFVGYGPARIYECPDFVQIIV
jgi:YegS/Rv2252/BmrU family lipid kinase